MLHCQYFESSLVLYYFELQLPILGFIKVKELTPPL